MKKVYIIYLLSFVLLISTIVLNGERLFPDKHYQKEFLEWMNKMNVHYSNEEFLYRFKIFSDNVDIVESWNRGGSETVLGLNKFADLSKEEFKSIYISKGGGIKLTSSNKQKEEDLNLQHKQDLEFK
ncbi:hypothetical protein ACTFIU_007075 [Dictyostelium citrinum]